MNKQTEALMRSLEALDHSLIFTSLMPGYDGLVIENAYKAIQAALAEQPAPVQQEPGRNHYEDGDVFERIAAMKTQPAQQEPVACVQDLDEVKRKHLVYEKGMDWKDPLYTSPQPAQRTDDTKRLDALAENSWDLLCFDMPTGEGDADIGWRVVEHYMAKPTERTVAEVFRDDPRQAIDEAIKAATEIKDAP